MIDVAITLTRTDGKGTLGRTWFHGTTYREIILTVHQWLRVEVFPYWVTGQLTMSWEVSFSIPNTEIGNATIDPPCSLEAALWATSLLFSALPDIDTKEPS